MAGLWLWLWLWLQLALFANTGVGAISISELPLHPELVCGSEPVRAAFAGCGLSGPTARCCQGLDAVFANVSSPSHGCLCVPQVLLKTLARGSQAGLDILGLLHKCRKTHGAKAFGTQWADAEPSECPRIPSTAPAAGLLALLGDGIVLPSSQDRGRWAWGNLLQFGELSYHVAGVGGILLQLLGARILQLLLVVIICMCPLFLLMHSAVLTPCSPVYRRLPAADRMIVCQHSVYALVFTLSVVPQTALAVVALLRGWTGAYLASWQLPALAGVFILSRAMLYLVEAAVRSVVKRSWLLIVHHQLFFIIVVIGCCSCNMNVLGMGIALDLFAVHEFPLYIGLVMYRLQARPALTSAVLVFAGAWYVLTRLLQTAMVGYMIAGFARIPGLQTAPEFIVTALLFGALTFIQAFTVHIYWGMFRKVRRAAGRARSTSADAAGCDDDEPMQPAASAKSANSLSDVAASATVVLRPVKL